MPFLGEEQGFRLKQRRERVKKHKRTKKNKKKNKKQKSPPNLEKEQEKPQILKLAFQLPINFLFFDKKPSPEIPVIFCFLFFFSL